MDHVLDYQVIELRLYVRIRSSVERRELMSSGVLSLESWWSKMMRCMCGKPLSSVLFNILIPDHYLHSLAHRLSIARYSFIYLICVTHAHFLLLHYISVSLVVILQVIADAMVQFGLFFTKFHKLWTRLKVWFRQSKEKASMVTWPHMSEPP
jgi:hypothetical protein